MQRVFISSQTVSSTTLVGLPKIRKREEMRSAMAGEIGDRKHARQKLRAAMLLPSLQYVPCKAEGGT